MNIHLLKKCNRIFTAYIISEYSLRNISQFFSLIQTTFHIFIFQEYKIKFLSERSIETRESHDTSGSPLLSRHSLPKRQNGHTTSRARGQKKKKERTTPTRCGFPKTLSRKQERGAFHLTDARTRRKRPRAVVHGDDSRYLATERIYRKVEDTMAPRSGSRVFGFCGCIWVRVNFGVEGWGFTMLMARAVLAGDIITVFFNFENVLYIR